MKPEGEGYFWELRKTCKFNPHRRRAERRAAERERERTELWKDAMPSLHLRPGEFMSV